MGNYRLQEIIKMKMEQVAWLTKEIEKATKERKFLHVEACQQELLLAKHHIKHPEHVLQNIA